LTLHNNQVKNDSNISNDSVNLTLNDSHNNTTNTSTTQKTYQTTKKSSSSKSSGSEDSWGDYEDDEWVYGHGAGSSDDPDIQWRHNKKTGYSEYYNTKTQESWGGYDIA
ncbi:MAG TPA: hypothetical protein HA255_01820, partial [Methanosphaera sp.]|nr:hypothetical protein [Methanosphaera sp.]